MNYQINDNVFTVFPKLETERLLLTAFVKSDAEKLFKIRSDDRVIKYLDRPAHKNISESELMINTILQNYKDKTGINWMIRKKDTSEVIGYVGYWRLIRENVRAEIGYAISPDYWGNGFMQETLSKIVDFGFKQFCLHSIEANVNPANIASIKLLEKSGFKREAYYREDYLFNGKYLDSSIYCLIESDYQNIDSSKM